jgi:hypothetical protein
MTSDNNQNSIPESIELNLGQRSINKQGRYNKTIVIPKLALDTLRIGNATQLNVSLVKTSTGEQFIKLSPVINKTHSDQINGVSK